MDTCLARSTKWLLGQIVQEGERRGGREGREQNERERRKEGGTDTINLKKMCKRIDNVKMVIVLDFKLSGVLFLIVLLFLELRELASWRK